MLEEKDENFSFDEAANASLAARNPVLYPVHIIGRSSEITNTYGHTSHPATRSLFLFCIFLSV